MKVLPKSISYEIPVDDRGGEITIDIYFRTDSKDYKKIQALLNDTFSEIIKHIPIT